MVASAAARHRGPQELYQLNTRSRQILLFATIIAGVAPSALSAQLTQACSPSTEPCQTCPPPASCSPPTNTCDGPAGRTQTFSTSHCTGAFAQTTATLEETVGPADICIGPERSIGFRVCPGSINLHTATSVVAAPGAPAVEDVPMSPWGLLVMAAGLAAVVLRRLRG